jgi:L-fuconate dehydratase
VVVTAVQSLASRVVGMTLAEIADDMGGFWRHLTGDSQLRWIGPEKGAIHLATAGIVNAVWDLWAKFERKPVWKLLVDMEPEALVGCLDFRYVLDALTPDEAIALLRGRHRPAPRASARCCATAIRPTRRRPAGLGYPDDKVRRPRAPGRRSADGRTSSRRWAANLAADMRRARLLREEIGWQRTLMMDANQVWEVDQAVAAMRRLAQFDPWWIEEPTSPDDILGHAAIRRRIAPDRRGHRRALPQPRDVQAAAAGRRHRLLPGRCGAARRPQRGAARRADGGEVRRARCARMRRRGLCEYVQHVSLFDYIAVSASLERRVLEYVDHLHEHFADPCVIRDGRYMPPSRPGYSIEMKPESLERYAYPEGPGVGREDLARHPGARRQGLSPPPAVIRSSRSCAPHPPSPPRPNSSTPGTPAHPDRPRAAGGRDGLLHRRIGCHLARRRAQPLHGIVGRAGRHEQRRPLRELHRVAGLLQARHVGQGGERLVAPVRERAQPAGP